MPTYPPVGPYRIFLYTTLTLSQVSRAEWVVYSTCIPQQKKNMSVGVSDS